MTIRGILRALRLIAAPDAVEREVDDEIGAHLDLETRHRVAAGMDPAAARRAAEAAFGPAVSAKQAVLLVHANPGARWPEVFAGDLRFALRSLRRHRVFSGVTLAVLALGIAAATLMFSVVSGVLLRPLPFRNPEQLVMVWGDYPDPSVAGLPEPVSGRQIKSMRENLQAFVHLSGFVSRQMNLGSGTAPQRVDGLGVNDDFFETLGVQPALGRAFRPGEELPGRDHEVVLGWALWQRSFGADRSVVGRSILLNGEQYTVVGVAPRGFAFPHSSDLPSTFQMPPATELWVPEQPPLFGPAEHAIIARVKPGTTLARAQADLDAMARIQERILPQARGWFNTRPVPLRTQVVGDVEQMLLVLLVAVGVLLAIACVNAAQLFLARLQARQGELAIRAALGASANRIARILLLESLLLTGGAGVVGTAVGAVALGALRQVAPASLPRLADVTFDSRAVLAAVGITLLAGILFGVMPAFGAARMRLADALRRGGRRTGEVASPRTRRMLIMAEIAMSVGLVTGSGLLIRSLAHQLGGDLGFSAPHALTFEVSLPALAYPERQGPTFMEHPRSVAFFTDALARLRAVPGVEAAAIGKPLPMTGAQENTVFAPENADPRVTAKDRHPVIDYTIASPQMFAALGTPILSGRDFNAADLPESMPVTIINAAAARWLWPGQDAVGKRLRMGGPPSGPEPPWITVVGVAADLRRYSLTRDPAPEMFVPYTQNPWPTFAPMQFVIRSRAGPRELAGPIQRAIAAVDPTIPVARLRTIDELVRDVSANARIATVAMSAFGAAALLLAMVGLYGVIACTVNQRRQEFGVRTALGATRHNIIRLVLVDGLTLTAAGLAIGAAFAITGGRMLRSMLYHVSVVDPLTFAATLLLLALTASLACFVPAMRAAGVDPRVALEEG